MAGGSCVCARKQLPLLYVTDTWMWSSYLTASRASIPPITPHCRGTWSLVQQSP